ncbi:MAG: peptide-methionine (S)-S-oxide reductase [Bacteroidetes bacterium HGW-Bacteroidetes-2]|jgi:peptide-methionine (S)-S-oxide reductase|nr:MAG: peptide-methionine (S)-S-oxide reductase [Bacteroidetes bacterium HGW-Bacteroidetes-2]
MKKIALVSSVVLLFFLSASCQNPSHQKKKEQETSKQETPVQTNGENSLRKAYFASGCFWCVELIYENVYGVNEVISGFSGGEVDNPTYKESNTSKTGHAEANEVIYDPNLVSFSTLVDVYFGSQNITQVNGQGPDIGSQYRSILFYQNDEEKKIIENKIAALNEVLDEEKVAAQVLPFRKFWIAEAYHQDYEKNNPNDRYVQNVSIPRLNRFKSKFPQLLKENN